MSAVWLRKLRRILTVLGAADRPEQLNHPKSCVHPLSGSRRAKGSALRTKKTHAEEKCRGASPEATPEIPAVKERETPDKTREAARGDAQEPKRKSVEMDLDLEHGPESTNTGDRMGQSGRPRRHGSGYRTVTGSPIVYILMIITVRQ